MNSPAWSAPPGLRHRVAEHPVQFDYTIVRKHRQLFAEGPDIQFKWLGPETVVDRADGEISLLEPCQAAVLSLERVSQARRLWVERHPQVCTVPSRQGGRVP
jgi:hypothetical protein